MRSNEVRWRCKKCGRGGTIDARASTPYSGLLIKIDGAHKLESPWCMSSFWNFEFVGDEAVGKEKYAESEKNLDTTYVGGRI